MPVLLPSLLGHAEVMHFAPMSHNPVTQVDDCIAAPRHLGHCLSYVAAAFMAGISQIGGTAECFSSENPINSRNWATTIAAVSVIVMTAQSFLNVLRDNTASFQDIALTVSTSLLSKMLKNYLAVCPHTDLPNMT